MLDFQNIERKKWKLKSFNNYWLLYFFWIRARASSKELDIRFLSLIRISFSRENVLSTGHSDDDAPTILMTNLTNILSSSLQDKERHKSNVWASLCFQMWSSVLLSNIQLANDAGTKEEFIFKSSASDIKDSSALS